MIDQAWIDGKRAEIANVRQRTQQQIEELVARLNRLDGGDVVLNELERALAGESTPAEGEQDES